ncbi:hypothetical protein B0H11DRAFT_1932320 [Mycena galericulata]|nr:hypothetical protein B0H11DRAFT_1932320 [Mycena galericulata]
MSSRADCICRSISCPSSKLRLRAGNTAASGLVNDAAIVQGSASRGMQWVPSGRIQVAASRGETSSSGGFARVTPQRVPLRRAQTARGDELEWRLRAGQSAASALETSSSCRTAASALETSLSGAFMYSECSGGFARGDVLKRRLRAGETAASALETNSSSETAASLHAQGWDHMEPSLMGVALFNVDSQWPWRGFKGSPRWNKTRARQAIQKRIKRKEHTITIELIASRSHHKNLT